MGKKNKKRKADAALTAPDAAAATPAAGAAAARPVVPRPAHKHTDVAPTGLGQQLASAPGRLASG